MAGYISRLTRNLVIERAGNKCEYCRLSQAITNYNFHIEHIVGIQHGGSDSLNNLAWCCSFCNWKKGPNLGTLLEDSNDIIPLFHPRTQDWFEHFEANKGLILPKTRIGIATANLLEFNLPERIEIRAVLHIAGFFP